MGRRPRALVRSPAERIAAAASYAQEGDDICASACGQAAERYRMAGLELLAAKEATPHGEWLPLLDEHGMSRSQAAFLMRVASSWDAIEEANVAHGLHLSTQRDLKKLLAKPRQPDPEPEPEPEPEHEPAGRFVPSRADLDDRIEGTGLATRKRDLKALADLPAEEQDRIVDLVADGQAETLKGAQQLLADRDELRDGAGQPVPEALVPVFTTLADAVRAAASAAGVAATAFKRAHQLAQGLPREQVGGELQRLLNPQVLDLLARRLKAAAPMVGCTCAGAGCPSCRRKGWVDFLTWNKRRQERQGRAS